MSSVDPCAAARLRTEVSHYRDYSCVTYEGSQEELVAAGVLNPVLVEWLGDRQYPLERIADHGDWYRLQRLPDGRLRLTVRTGEEARMPRPWRTRWNAVDEQVVEWLRSKGLQSAR